MTLQMIKFGNILNSRPAGRDAALRAKQIVNGSNEDGITLDFSSVEVLTPSFADQFITDLKGFYVDKNINILGFESNVVIKDTLIALKLI